MTTTVDLWLTDHRDATGNRITGETWSVAGSTDPLTITTLTSYGW